jgi:hypothetical protein
LQLFDFRAYVGFLGFRHDVTRIFV